MTNQPSNQAIRHRGVVATGSVTRSKPVRRKLVAVTIFIVCTVIAAGCSSAGGSSENAAASEGAEDFSEWAKANAKPIASLDLGADQSDLDELEEIVGDSQVVAIGETAHNVSEQLETRSRLLSYLVEKLGFRLLAAETSMPHAERINDYVLGEEADIDELLRQSGTWELMATTQMRAAIEWIRQYNSTVTDGDFVQFYGIDVVTPLPALESLDTYLRSVDGGLADSLSSTFDDLRPLLSQQGDETWRTLQSRYDEAPAEDVATLSTQLQDLRAQMQSVAEEYAAASSTEEFDQALRWATVLSSGHETLAVQASAGPPDSAERVRDGSKVRDPAMADNVMWVLDQNPGQRLVLWANNLHVQRNDPDRVFRAGDSFEVAGITTMGGELAASLGPAYFVMHAALHGGNTPDYGQLPDVSDDSLDAALNLAGPELFYLDIRSLPDDRPGGAWIRSPQSMRAEIGTVTLLPTTNFDAVYFVSSGTPAQELGQDG